MRCGFAQSKYVLCKMADDTFNRQGIDISELKYSGYETAVIIGVEQRRFFNDLARINPLVHHTVPLTGYVLGEFAGYELVQDGIRITDLFRLFPVKGRVVGINIFDNRFNVKKLIVSLYNNFRFGPQIIGNNNSTLTLPDLNPESPTATQPI